MREKKTMSRGAKQALVEGLIMAVLAVLGAVYGVPKLGMFGVVWVVAAGAIALVDLYRALIKSRRMGRNAPAAPAAPAEPPAPPASEPCEEGPAEERLRKLQSLRDEGLLTPEEYEQKRHEILRDL